MRNPEPDLTLVWTFMFGVSSLNNSVGVGYGFGFPFGSIQLPMPALTPVLVFMVPAFLKSFAKTQVVFTSAQPFGSMITPAPDLTLVLTLILYRPPLFQTVPNFGSAVVVHANSCTGFDSGFEFHVCASSL